MNFTPETRLIICKDVPLNTSYQDTITFASASAQEAFFVSKKKYSFTDFTYQREQNVCRIPINAELLYDCNYVMYQNKNFGTKWFYAFITNIEYRNPDTTFITFEIDVLQTWYFDVQFKECMIDREHVSNDTPFTWFAPEPFAPSDYTCSTSSIWFGHIPLLGIEPSITLACTKDAEIGEAPNIYSGIFSGLWFVSVPVSSYQSVVKFIDALAESGKSDAIVSIFMSAIPVLPGEALFKDIDTKVSPTSRDFNGYTIHNNKLLQYPFCKIKVLSTDGNTMELKPELVRGSTLKCRLWFCAGFPPSIVFVPEYATMISQWDYALQYNEAPQCAWSNNVFANWQAQNVVSNTLNKIGSAASIIPGAYNMSTGGVPGVSDLNGIVQAAKPWATEYEMSILPGKMGGVPNGASMAYATNRLGFEAWPYKCMPGEAKMFDEYFDRYGYAIRQVKKPNITGRASWNYVKTDGAIVLGSAPADDLAKIRSILDRGITFWHGDYVGDYSRSNGIVG